MKNKEEQMAHNRLNGLTQTTTAIEWLEERFYFIKGQLIDIDFEQAKEMEIKEAHEYAKFAIRCDRKDMKILNFDSYINLKNTKQCKTKKI